MPAVAFVQNLLASLVTKNPKRLRQSELAGQAIGRVLTGAGFFEVVTFSFTTAKQAQPFLMAGQVATSVSDDRRGSDNIFETSDVPADRVQTVAKIMKPALDHRVNKTKWVVLRWPSSAMAQQAGVSTQAFEDFYFRVCTFDYRRYGPGMKALADLMNKTDRVHLKGPGTDLRFSIKGIGAVPCGGLRNIPDGEVFSCPVKESVEGVIQYNAPTVYLGTSFDNIRLVFRKGRIVEATSNNTKRLNEILDTDAGSRYIGEFAIGFNPHILEPMRDILFDEKIAGSFHFTPGQAYEIGGNGNKSAVHWDMVNIQRPEYGGGEIWFDGKLIRKDGLFTLSSLKKLNPDQLLKQR